MDIISLLITKDTNLFLFLNSFHNSFFDSFMSVFSEKLTWVPFYIAVLYASIRRWKKESIWIILALVLCIVLADQTASGLLKDWVQRPRPSREPVLDGLVHLVNGRKAGLYGFASSHAANSFAFALLSTLIFRHRFYGYTVFAWAILNSYSRIYLGVHYPGDILAGIIIGLISALIMYFILTRTRPRHVLFERTRKRPFSLSLHKTRVTLPIAIMFLSVVCITIYSFIML